jgi:aerobic carbon-monoxide dehydrogenase medium subunit
MAFIAEYFAPCTLSETHGLLENTAESKMLAGGTDLLLKLQKQKDKPITIISLKNIKRLKEIIKENDSSIFIGSMVSLRSIENHKLLSEIFPALIEAAYSIGSPSLRTTATIGGNICNASPSADMAPPLLVYEASALVYISGKEKKVPVSKFFIGPGSTILGHNDILVGFYLPDPGPLCKSGFLKHSRGKGMDVATVNTSISLTMEEGKCIKAKIALGAVAPCPILVPGSEKILIGKQILNSQSVIREAADAAAMTSSPIDDVRASAEYRKSIAGTLVYRLLQSLLNKKEKL